MFLELRQDENGKWSTAPHESGIARNYNPRPRCTRCLASEGEVVKFASSLFVASDLLQTVEVLLCEEHYAIEFEEYKAKHVTFLIDRIHEIGLDAFEILPQVCQHFHILVPKGRFAAVTYALRPLTNEELEGVSWATYAPYFEELAQGVREKILLRIAADKAAQVAFGKPTQPKPTIESALFKDPQYNAY